MPFEDIKGQDSALTILRENLKRGRVFQNYLFVGPDSAGKFFAAVNFAKAVNCLETRLQTLEVCNYTLPRSVSGVRVEPCEKCSSCRKINSKSHPDVFFVKPGGVSSSIGIDEIREIIKGANLKPYEGRKKVFIIDSAHKMNDAASNAFLKTLEEPPKNNVFILISRSEEALLPTIVSRCHIIKFSRAPREPAEGLNEKKNLLLDSLTKGLSRELGSYSNKEELKEKLGFLISYFRDMAVYKAVRNEERLFHIDRIEEIKNRSEKFSQGEFGFIVERLITLCSYLDYNVNPKLIVDAVSNELRGLSAQIN